MTRHVLPIAFFLLAPCLLQAQTWRGHFDRSGPVLRVCNPELAAAPAETIAARLLWSFGDEDSEHILGRVAGLAAGPEGATYILDGQRKEVAVYDETGRYTGHLGREGDGPGEFRRPHDLVVDNDGNVLVLQVFPGRIFRLDPEGIPLADWPVPIMDNGSSIMLSSAAPSPLGMVAHRYTVKVDDAGGLIKRNNLALLDQEGDVSVVYCERVSERAPGDNVRVEGDYAVYLSEWHVGPTGEVVVRTSWHDYELTVFEAGGAPQRVIRRQYESRRRRPDTIDGLQRYHDEQDEGRRWRANVGPIVHAVSEQDADVQLFTVRDDGAIWVLTSRGALDAPRGVIGIFDVFDNEGRFMRQVTLRGDGDFWRDDYVISGDRLYVITNQSAQVRGWHRPGEADDPGDDGRRFLCYELPR